MSFSEGSTLENSSDDIETQVLRDLLQKQLPSCNYTSSSASRNHHDSGFASASSTRPHSVLCQYDPDSSSSSGLYTPLPLSPYNSIPSNSTYQPEADNYQPQIPSRDDEAKQRDIYIVTEMLGKIRTCSEPAQLKQIVKEMYYFCTNSNNVLTICDCVGVPVLVSLLSYSNADPVLFYSINLIHTILLENKKSKVSFRLAGGLEKMVQLLFHSNVNFLIVMIECLYFLAFSHPGSKVVILSSGGPVRLIQLMKEHVHNEQLLWTVSRLLKALSVCPSNKPEIVQAGGMQVLLLHLGHRSNRLVQNILFTLRNLSDAATKQDNLDELLQQLIGFLSSNDVHYLTCAAGVLSNLTCNNAKNKTIVCQLRGIEALIRTIGNNTDKGEVIERCVCTLRHITSRHLAAEMAQNAVRELNSIPMLMNLLQTQTRYPLIKALIGLFRNLSLCSDNHTVLRENGFIIKVWQLLNRSFQDLPRQPPVLIDGTYVCDIIDSCTVSLLLLSGDPYNRLIMKQLNAVPMLVQLLYLEDDRVQSTVLKILKELSLDQDGIELIEKENGSYHISRLVTSSSESLATEAVYVLSLIMS